MDRLVRCNRYSLIVIRYYSNSESYACNRVNLLFRSVIISCLLVGASASADLSDIEGRWLSGDKSGWIDIRLVDGKPVGIAKRL